jgi:hypothetical protein
VTRLAFSLNWFSNQKCQETLHYCLVLDIFWVINNNHHGEEIGTLFQVCPYNVIEGKCWLKLDIGLVKLKSGFGHAEEAMD